MLTELQGKWFRINYLTSLILKFHISTENNSTHLRSSEGKESACQSRRPRFDAWVRKIQREQQPPQWSCLEFQAQRSLMGYSPCGCKERHNWAISTITISQTAIKSSSIRIIVPLNHYFMKQVSLNPLYREIKPQTRLDNVLQTYEPVTKHCLPPRTSCSKFTVSTPQTLIKLVILPRKEFMPLLRRGCTETPGERSCEMPSLILRINSSRCEFNPQGESWGRKGRAGRASRGKSPHQASGSSAPRANAFPGLTLSGAGVSQRHPQPRRPCCPRLSCPSPLSHSARLRPKNTSRVEPP